MLICLEQYYATIRYRDGSKMKPLEILSRLCSIQQRDEIPINLHVDHIAFTKPDWSKYVTRQSCLVLA